jgi:mycothiol system anti-sigma-R factor
MSCGKPHETPCSEVLAELYAYLDEELDPPSSAKIHQHLDECGPCLREYGLEEVVKKLVHRCCGHEAVPQELRVKVLVRIQEVRRELELIEIRPE